MRKDITIVTGMWDIGRGDVNENEVWCKRDWEGYKRKFFELLGIDVQFFIFCDKELEQEIREKFDMTNKYIRVMEANDFKTFFAFYEDVQRIRKNEKWLAQEGWIPGSPQASLELYNPLVMSKMHLLNDAQLINPFSSNYFYWIDGGIFSTVNSDLFRVDKVFDKLGHEDFTFLSYPYTEQTQIHGFERKAIAQYCGVDFVPYVIRGGFFGGYKATINQLNAIYYHLCGDTLGAGYMGTEESIFTIIAHKYPDLANVFDLGGGGVQPFFEYLRKLNDTNQVAFYAISYNCPDQFEALLKSIEDYDPEMLQSCTKYLLNNSDDHSTDARYKELCEEWGFSILEKNEDNLGITGGRQFIAEHFDTIDCPYMIYYEDDMMMMDKKKEDCADGTTRYVMDNSGFTRNISKLFYTALSIIRREKLDFLKFNWEEVFATNSTQTAWYNVSQQDREKYWDNRAGLPFTEFKEIKIFNGFSYAIGKVFYCNWPHIMSKEGSRKVFIEREWLAPSEHRIMSYAYKLSEEGKLKSAVFLASPVQHRRLFDYDREKRKEF